MRNAELDFKIMQQRHLNPHKRPFRPKSRLLTIGIMVLVLIAAVFWFFPRGSWVGYLGLTERTFNERVIVFDRELGTSVYLNNTQVQMLRDLLWSSSFVRGFTPRGEQDWSEYRYQITLRGGYFPQSIVTLHVHENGRLVRDVERWTPPLQALTFRGSGWSEELRRILEYYGD